MNENAFYNWNLHCTDEEIESVLTSGTLKYSLKVPLHFGKFIPFGGFSEWNIFLNKFKEDLWKRTSRTFMPSTKRWIIKLLKTIFIIIQRNALSTAFKRSIYVSKFQKVYKIWFFRVAEEVINVGIHVYQTRRFYYPSYLRVEFEK